MRDCDIWTFLAGRDSKRRGHDTNRERRIHVSGKSTDKKGFCGLVNLSVDVCANGIYSYEEKEGPLVACESLHGNRLADAGPPISFGGNAMHSAYN